MSAPSKIRNIVGLFGIVLLALGWSLPSAATGIPGLLFFEDGFESWNGWTIYQDGSVEQSDSVARTGTYSLRKFEASDPHGGYKTVGLEFGRNVALECWIYRPSSYAGGAADRLALSDAQFDGYGINIQPTFVAIERRDEGSGTTLEEASWSRPENNWYRVVFVMKEDNSFELTTYDTDGAVLGSVTAAADTAHEGFDRLVVHGGYEFFVDQVRLYDLSQPPAKFLPATPFTLADLETGSERFTNSNEVDVTSFPVPNECDSYQVTLSDEASTLDPNGWVSTNTLPTQLDFAQPAADSNIVLYAWFTNSVTNATLYRGEGRIYFTEVLPAPNVRPTLTRERLSGSNVAITASDIDFGSTGGEANGLVLDVVERIALAANPTDDLTPEAPYVTVASEGEFPLLLRLKNEAGTLTTSVATCLVSVVSYSGTNTWTGLGYTDDWSDGANWSAGVPTAGQDVAIRAGNGARLAEATPEFNSFELTGGSLVFSDWNSRLNAKNVAVLDGTITCAGDFDEFSPSNRVWIGCQETFLLAKPGKIDVNGKGYTSESGPGVGVTTAHGTGGGHGGQGGFGYKRGGLPMAA